jgi:DNA-binding MarR family transcriptional regulator
MRHVLPLTIVPRIERAVHQVALLLARHAKLGASQAEAHVLAYLYGHGPSGLLALHRAFGHRRSTLTSVLDRLETRGLLRRTRSAGDRRAYDLTLTPAGRRRAARVHGVLLALERKSRASFAPADLASFERVLAALESATKEA